MREKLLESIGLSQGEQKTYLTLFRLGASTTGPIVKDSGMQKSTVYFCLEKLIKKGLVSHFMRNNVRVFEVSHPKRIIDYLDEKESAIEKQKKAVKALIPGFEARALEKGSNHSAKVFEGWKGLKTGFEDIIDSIGAGEDYFVLGVTTVPATKERFRRFIRQFHLRRAAKKIRSKLLLNIDLIDSIGLDREEEPYTEVRYIESTYFTPAIANIYGDRVFFTVWSPPYGFQLKSREVAASFKNYFRVLWKGSKTRMQIQGKKVKPMNKKLFPK